MSKLELKKPNKSQVIKAATTTLGGAAGYLGYDKLTQSIPVTKEMNLVALGGSVLVRTMIKGDGIAFNIVNAILLGVAVGSAAIALEDFNIIKPVGQKVLAPVADEDLADADELNSLYEDVEYIQDAILIQDDEDIKL